jgi:CRISPR-associated protein Cas2
MSLPVGNMRRHGACRRDGKLAVGDGGRGPAHIGLMPRTLYLVAYDISDPRRLARALKVVRAYATGGQKSVHECWLLPGELVALKRELDGVIDHRDDSVLFVRLDPRMKPRTLGIARPPADPAFFFVG